MIERSLAIGKERAARRHRQTTLTLLPISSTALFQARVALKQKLAENLRHRRGQSEYYRPIILETARALKELRRCTAIGKQESAAE